jgi:hypothetical protein
MRQAVDPANASVTAETGFRCAASADDPNRAAGQISGSHVAPATTVAPSKVTVPATIAPGVLVRDTFENPKSGWPTRKDDASFAGYHAPTWYHVDASKAGVQTLSLLGVDYSDIRMVARVFVDKTGTPDGRFRYGLAFRVSGPIEAPPAGIAGPPRNEDFYGFVVDPRSQRWYLVHDDTLPYRILTSGRVAVTGLDPTKPDTLRVDAIGRHLTFFVNGRQVGTWDTRNYHLSGDIGFFVETLTETRAHVHFDDLEVTRQAA